MRTTLFLSTFTLVLALATLTWAQRSGEPPSEMTHARYCQAVGQLAARVEKGLTQEKLTPSQILLREGAQPVSPEVLAYMQADAAHRPLLAQSSIPSAERWQTFVRGIVYRVSRRPGYVNVQNAMETFCLHRPDTLLFGRYIEGHDIW